MLRRVNARHWKAFPVLIDYFALGLIHALIAIALLRLAGRDTTDRDPAFDDAPGMPDDDRPARDA